MSKLLYAMASMWLNAAARRRLDGFHNRCLRAIWGIKPAFVSRVSNASVLETTQQQPLSCLLEKQQLLLYGKAARQHDQHPMRVATFCPGSLRPATERFIRKVGRPRAEWAVNVQCLAIRPFGSIASAHTVKGKAEWRNTVEQFYKR